MVDSSQKINAPILTFVDGIALKPIPLLQERVPLWELSEVNGASRESIQIALGSPHHVERDSTRTFGGEEDSWRFLLPSGCLLFAQYRVPYLSAVLVSNTPAITEELGRVIRSIPGEARVHSVAYERL